MGMYCLLPLLVSCVLFIRCTGLGALAREAVARSQSPPRESTTLLAAIKESSKEKDKHKEKDKDKAKEPYQSQSMKSGRSPPSRPPRRIVES